MNRKIGLAVSTALAFGPVGIIWTFLPIHLRSLNASFSTIALVSFIPAVETIVLSPFWGGLLDKYGNANKILLVSILAEAIGFSIFPFLNNPFEYVTIICLVGVFSASFIPVYSAIATLSSPQNYGRGIGHFWTAASVGYATAGLLGGLVYELFGANYLFILGASYGFLGCIIMLLVSDQNFTITRSLALSHGYWKLLRDRNIAVLCILSIVILIGSSAFNSFFTLYLVDFLNSSRLVAGLAATGTTTCGAIAYRYVGPLNDKLGRKPVFLLGTIGYALYFTILYFVTNPGIVTVLWIFPIYPFIQSSAAALVADYTSPGDRGKGLGLLEASLSLGGGIGPLIGGTIADAASFQSIIIFSLVVSIISIIGARTLLRENKPVIEEIVPTIPQTI